MTSTLSLTLMTLDEEDNCKKHLVKEIHGMKLREKNSTTTMNTTYQITEKQLNRLSTSRPHHCIRSGHLFASLNKLTLLIIAGTPNLITEIALR